MAKPKQTATDEGSLPKQRTGFFTFFRESWHELRRVRWPSRSEVVNYTTAALLVCIFLGVFVWLVDIGVAKLMSLIGMI